MFTIYREELCRVFELLEDKKHWKNPIAKTINLNSKEFENVSLGMISEAVEFFTSTKTTITELGNGQYFVQSVGYFNGPAN